MKKQITLVMGMLMSGFLSAQSVSYRTIEDDPDNIKNLAISLDPFYADAWGTDITLGFGVRADMYFKNLLSFNFDLRRAYLDLNAKEHEDASLPKPNDDLKKHLYVEAGAQLSFLNRSKQKDLKVVLSSSSSSSGGRTVTHSKYIMVPGTIRKLKQLRFGLISTRAAIDLADATGDGTTFKATSKTNSANTFTIGDFANTVDGSPTYGGYTMMSYSAIYAGIGAKRITNLQVDTDYGIRDHAYCFDLFADVVYAPILNFADVYTTGGTAWEVSNEDVTRIGWRLGAVVRSSVKSRLSYRTELGTRPGFRGGEGILSTNVYVLITLGWSIPFKLSVMNPS